MPRALSIPLLVLIGIALASCAEHQPQQQAQAAAEAQAQAQARAASDDAQCRSYGAEPGSPGYVQCRMNLDNQHAQDLRQRRAWFNFNLGSNCLIIACPN